MGLFGPKQRRKVNITSREVSETVVPGSGQTGACSADSSVLNSARTEQEYFPPTHNGSQTGTSLCWVQWMWTFTKNLLL